MTNRMTREQIAEIISDARATSDKLNPRGADLTNLDLSNMDLFDMDLRDVDLSGSNMSGTNLRCADLAYAKLHRTNLRYADLAYANLYNATPTKADLSDTNLRYTNMYGAELTGADLRRAYMHDTNLTSADLSSTKMCGLFIDGLPSGRLIFNPTPEGWHLYIGCWEGTIQELRAMIAGDDGWPEARGEEITVRRPMLETMAAACEAYAAAHPDALDEVRETADRWE